MNCGVQVDLLGLKTSPQNLESTFTEELKIENFTTEESTCGTVPLTIQTHHSPYLHRTATNISNLKSCWISILNKLTLISIR